MSENKRLFAEAFRMSLLLVVLFELLSFLGFIYPVFSDMAFLVIVAVTALVALKRIDLAFLVLLAELFIGSQGGYLVSYGIESGLNISLRMGLFLVVGGIWLAQAISAFLERDPGRREMLWRRFREVRASGLFWPFIALIAILALGVVRGILGGNTYENIFFDANGYAYFALFPVFLMVFRGNVMRMRVLGLLSASVLVSVAKALFVEYIFSHRVFFVASPLYTWIRDTRVGEITIMAGDFYRIFFQAHVFALVFIFIVVVYLAYWRSWKSKRAKAALVIAGTVGTAMLMSLSRSFWFGAFVAGIIMLFLLKWGRAKKEVWGRVFSVAGISLAGGVFAILLVYSIPFPQRGADVSFASLFGSRMFSVTGEAAATSRWALLPVLNQAGWEHPVFGSGLGTTVTYTTSDPRLLADTPTGEYTTFAFEWGYHDLWVKFGFIGLMVYAWFLAAIYRPWVATLKRGRSHLREPFMGRDYDSRHAVIFSMGIILALSALLATNIFSPYLNHPLGIGILMLIAALGMAKEEPA